MENVSGMKWHNLITRLAYLHPRMTHQWGTPCNVQHQVILVIVPWCCEHMCQGYSAPQIFLLQVEEESVFVKHHSE